MMIRDLERVTANPYVRELTEIVAELNLAAWLVGGVIRDALLGRDLNDFDIAHSGPAGLLPRRFAEITNGTFFWLDQERGHGRVVRKIESVTLTFDFAPIQGDGICQDLEQRDFTINALALPLIKGVSRPIDPLAGSEDLSNGRIRPCSSTAFSADPLRLLRAIRFAALPGFSIENKVRTTIARNANLLSSVARERIRDEFFKIISAPMAAESLGTMHDTGLLVRIFPLPENVTPALNQIEAIDRIANALDRLFPLDSQAIGEFLQYETEQGVTPLALLKLAALLQGRNDKTAATTAAGLRLGNKSEQVLASMLNSAASLTLLEKPLQKIAMYRFFTENQHSGPASAILALAKNCLTEQECAKLISYYLHDHKSTSDSLHLSGTEIMEISGIPPGPVIGNALEQLREAESIGQVSNKPEAREFIEKILLTNNEPIR